jgi:hypothetical protein
MIISMESTEEGERRIYCTRGHSIVSYFSDDGEGGSMLSVEPGELLYSYADISDRLQAVRHAVLTDVAKRLACDIAEVQAKPMTELATLCAPHLKHQEHCYGRRRAKRPFVR